MPRSAFPLSSARAKHLGIGIAITDHNEIEGTLEACDNPFDTLVIPGDVETKLP